MAENPNMEEIAFLASLTNAEVARLRARVLPGSVSSDDKTLAQTQEKLLEELGRLSARLLIVEELLEQNVLDIGPTPESVTTNIAEDLTGSRPLLAHDFYDPLAFHEIETGSNGQTFAWSSGKAVEFKIDISAASQARYLQIFFIAIARPSYAKSAALFIDGTKQDHRVLSDDGELCLETRLPKTIAGSITLKLELPSTHPLLETAQSGTDGRSGGIAITRIVFAEESRASLLRRLLS